MALWLVRTGKYGEFENKFLSENNIYLTWEQLNVDLGKIKAKQELSELLEITYPEHKKNTLRNHLGQIWAFSQEIKPGDWIVTPSKRSSTIHFAIVKSKYKFNPKAEDPFYHSYEVEWFATDIPRTRFDQDLLYSFGAFMSVCRIKRNNAENRIKIMASNNWTTKKVPVDEKIVLDPDENSDQSEYSDIEEISYDQIAKYITRKFKGHEMAVLLEAVLRANGYATYRSSEGPDKGIDILAGKDSLGFGDPKLCVQVKTGDAPVDRPTLDQLIGVIQNVKAEYGLLVSWGGFKSSVLKEAANQFFRVRLWDQKDTIREVLKAYDKLDEDIKTELPLKRVYVLSFTEDPD